MTTNDDARAALLKWTPGGSQTASKAPGRAGPTGAYPAALVRGSGAQVWDVTQRPYIDYVASLAAVGLGHAYPPVQRALTWQLKNGSLLSLPTLLEAEVSEMLCTFTGRWAQQVRWVKTGSEATAAAVRIARMATGRDRVLTIVGGYHGWHDWFQAVKPSHPGVPIDLTSLIWDVAYGDIADAEAFLARYPFACVILEPAPIGGGGDATFLAAVRKACDRTGTLLIFDEMVWGARLAKAGGTEHFGITPDLACYGKAIGNGVPVAAVIGPRELMQHATVISGTFGGDTLGLAAVKAVVTAYLEHDVISTLWDRGSQLQRGFADVALHVAQRVGPTGATMTGYAVHPIVKFTGVADEPATMSLFLQEMAARGVLFHPGGLNVMYAHTKVQIDQTVALCQEALTVVARALDKGTVRQQLQGEPYAQAFARATLTVP